MTMEATAPTATDWVERARELAPELGATAAAHDRTGEFVAPAYARLKEEGFFSAGIPIELGGGGASHRTVAAVIREIARHDGSTALAYAMHAHPVATNVFKHLRGDEGSTAALERIAANRWVIAGSGANDWLSSNGSAVEVEGGFRVDAHKRFASGSSGADLFVTSARLEGPSGPEVIHFAVPFSAEGVRLVETWDSHGMRGTGSNDVILENVFVPEASVVVRRAADVWHPSWNVVAPVALPLIVAAYVGLAEAAAEHALEAVKKHGGEYAAEVGAMLNDLAIARMALDDMLRITDDYRFTPSIEVADAVLQRKSIAAEAVGRAVDRAADLVGGAGFLRGHPVERIVRDVRAAHFHPLPERKQRRFTGRLGLGLDPV